MGKNGLLFVIRDNFCNIDPVGKRVQINIIWFKRDLRVTDHKPLVDASKKGYPVLPLYVAEEEYWRLPDASKRHWSFIADCLASLRKDLEAIGQGLVVRVGEVIKVFSQFAERYEIMGIFAHEETGNGWTFKRDIRVAKWCQEMGIPLHEYPSNGVVRRLKSRDDWSKIRNSRMDKEVLGAPEKIMGVDEMDLGKIPEKDWGVFEGETIYNVQKGGRTQGLEVLRSFLEVRGTNYLYDISKPGKSEESSSRLSPYLAWGALSVKEVLKAVEARIKSLNEEDLRRWKRHLVAFKSRLSWRCHFIQKMEDRPEIEFRCMHEGHEGMREDEHNEDYFRAWKIGMTGYPFIDACMRNLIHEGWITFRMRAMLVSFASYDLWLDWRKTGHYLARLFTDYEPGIHYSQMQMQSGVTGINAFRIYNPIKQSKDHDTKGLFIRKWVKELKNVPLEYLHEPWKMGELEQKMHGCILGEDYPWPVVDHLKAVKEAKSKISKVRQGDDYREISKKVYERLGSRKRTAKKKPRKKVLKDKDQLFFELGE